MWCIVFIAHLFTNLTLYIYRRQYDSIDKRFCFDVVAEDKSAPYTFQALSDDDRKLWLDAMDGIEPVSTFFYIALKPFEVL